MKKLLIPTALLAVFASILLYSYFWWSGNSEAVDESDTQKYDFLVLKGRGATEIGQSLYEEGFIKSPLAFKFYVQLNGKAEELQAGEFKLSPSDNLVEVVDILTSPPSEIWITIPEGLRSEEIVDIFIKDLQLDEGEATEFQAKFLSQTVDKEGYLFPDTYLLPHDASAKTAMALMETTFDKRTQDIKESLPDSLSFEEVVTLASLIEREAKTDEERPVIAGILLNRLEIGMPLQVDASVQYAVANQNCSGAVNSCADWWPILTREDLDIDSPYNTYKYWGLPKEPISNPGLSSIGAAANPQVTEYFYYIHDTSGKIHYAKTLQGHNENVRVYLNK